MTFQPVVKGNRKYKETSWAKTPEMALAVLCCRRYLGTLEQQDLENFLNHTAIDWPEFQKTCMHQRIHPIAFRELIGSTRVPRSIRKSLSNRLIYSTGHIMKKAAELGTLLKTLHENHIQALPYNGIAFATQFYGSPLLRDPGDFDLIIPKKDIGKSIEILRKLGYTDEDASLIRRFGIVHYLDRYKDYPLDRYENGKRVSHIELHNQVLSKHVGVPAIYNTFDTSNTVEIELAGGRFRTLSDSAHLQAVLLHHVLQDRLGHLRSLVDLALCLKKTGISPMNYVENYLNIHLVAGTIQEVLGLDLRMPSGSKLPGREIQERNFFKVGPKPVTGSSLIILFRTLKFVPRLLKNPSDKINFFVKAINQYFIPQKNDFHWVRLPQNLIFLYFLVRPIRISFHFFKLIYRNISGFVRVSEAHHREKSTSRLR